MLRTLLFSLFMMSAGSAFAQTTIETARGPVSLDGVPQTIAAYDVAAIDTLDALGVPVKGAIDRLFLPYLDDVAAEASVVGTIFEPDLEALNAIEPDLTIIGGRSAKQLDAVSRVSKAVDMTIGTDVVSDGFQRLETYGKLFGKEEQAAQIRADLEARFDATRAALGEGKTALVLMTNGTKMSAYGKTGRFGWLYNRLGLEPATEISESNHGEAISFEFINQANPDLLLVIDRQAAIGADGAEAAVVLDNALVHETKAWKQNGVIYLNASAAYIAAGGVQAMGLLLVSIDEAVAQAK
ncbi:siderophore ABC transporter substrate-binding protein [uncultured Cohaesibacter sp.]|uniref:siderophore ABC transporter substrate-binding protein n=1 Tax=uncultured Cohaesibacter sp. TaxID=1002546 RepID=UPI0029C76266|nr:siderophore ABC transporter substrate-binding protein [uncultured Cohaesibacter sp.]